MLLTYWPVTIGLTRSERVSSLSVDLRSSALQAMEVDLYRLRASVQTDAEEELAAPLGAVLDKAALDLDSQGLREESRPKSDVSDSAEIERVRRELELVKKSLLLEEPKTEERKIEDPKAEDSKAELQKASPSASAPLRYLWAANSTVLFLAEAQAATIENDKQLFGAILTAISSKGFVDAGGGDWQPRSGRGADDRRAFFDSFAQAKAEQHTDGLAMVVLGENLCDLWFESQSYEELCGTRHPGSGSIREIRVGPSLADMRNRPYTKAQLWQLIKDLRTA